MLKVIGVLAVVTLLTACAPRDLSGVYVAKQSDSSGLLYMTLTSSSPTQLVGQLTGAGVLGSERSGVKTYTYPVSGTVNDNHIVFYANNQQTTADLSGNGFTLTVPSTSGRIEMMEFRRSSTAEVNKLVAEIDKRGQAARIAYLQTATATVELTNLSSGTSEFYVDHQPSCNAPPDTHCTVSVRVIGGHILSAVTSYGDSSYQTPATRLYAEPNADYKFESCGETGTPGQNCGLFTISSGQ